MQKPKINFQKVSFNLLKGLAERPKEVIIRRYGLLTGHPETLQEIGDSWDITRERVRQIEEGAFRVLRESPKFSKIEQVFSALKDYLSFLGGVKKEDLLFYNLGPESQHPALSLILELSPLERVPENSKFFTFWMASSQSKELAKRIIDFLVKRFEKDNTSIGKTDLEGIYRKEIIPTFGRKVTPEAFNSYLEISKEIKNGPFEKIGLAHWSEITPRGVRDKAYLTFKKELKPLHFQELTDLINKYFYSGKETAQTQTVHNELIKDSRFILVGRGIYALSEWGYKPGVVKEVIASVLKESKKPLKKEEIIQKVLTQRQVKKNTILFNLGDKKYFGKTAEGKYYLA